MVLESLRYIFTRKITQIGSQLEPDLLEGREQVEEAGNNFLWLVQTFPKIFTEDKTQNAL